MDTNPNSRHSEHRDAFALAAAAIGLFALWRTPRFGTSLVRLAFGVGWILFWTGASWRHFVS